MLEFRLFLSQRFHFCQLGGGCGWVAVPDRFSMQLLILPAGLGWAAAPGGRGLRALSAAPEVTRWVLSLALSPRKAEMMPFLPLPPFSF